MARRSPAHTVLVLLTVGSLMAFAGWLQLVRERAFPSPSPAAEGIYITSGKTLRRLTAGYNALASDLYWIRAIQYYGGIKLRLADGQPLGQGDPGAPTDFGLLYPLLDITTTLDPRFNIAYRFGAVFLAEPFPSGAGRPDLAIALLQKGLEEMPDKWEYMQDIGFVHYWWRQDYEAAAASFGRAASVPGAPWWLRSLAAVTLAEGGDRRSSRLMWQAIHESAEIDWLRRESARRLAQLRALDEIDALQVAVDRLTKDAGAPPTDWAPLVRAALVAGLPRDPTGEPYRIDSNGRVHVSPTSELFPLPDEPKRLIPRQ
jgi:hypothetical protein